MMLMLWLSLRYVMIKLFMIMVNIMLNGEYIYNVNIIHYLFCQYFMVSHILVKQHGEYHADSYTLC